MCMLSTKEFNGAIEAALGPMLLKSGFEKIKDLHWVHDLGTGVRRVVTLMHWQGLSSNLHWGYSLDYVPHFDNAGKKIYWHRTNKSARLDVRPIFFDFHKYDLSKLCSIDHHINLLKQQAPPMIEDMDSFFGMGGSISDLVVILEKCKDYSAPGWGFWSWTQLPLAYAFTLKKSGDIQKASEVLDEIIARNKYVPAAKQKLIERFNETNK